MADLICYIHTSGLLLLPNKYRAEMCYHADVKISIGNCMFTRNAGSIGYADQIDREIELK